MRYLCNLLYFSIILDVRSFPSYAPDYVHVYNITKQSWRVGIVLVGVGMPAILARCLLQGVPPTERPHIPK